MTTLPSLSRAALLVAPALLLLSSLLAALGDGINSDAAGGAVQVYAAAAFVLVVLNLARLIEARFPRAVGILVITGMIGAVSGASFGIASIGYSVTGQHLQEAESVAVQLGLLLPGLLFPLTLIAFGISLLRTDAALKIWAAALMVGGVLFPISRIGGIEVLALVADVVLLAALAGLWSSDRYARPAAVTAV